MYGNADIEISKVPHILKSTNPNIEISINPNRLISTNPNIEISKVLHILKSAILDKSKKDMCLD